MKKATYILTAIAYIILLSFVIRNLDTETLWYDEAGQFFIAKGLNHFSPPFSPEGTLADVIYNNAHYNLDPGGFSILLHFWSMISNNHIWLRLLPFIFFILTIFYTYKVIFTVSKDKPFSFIGGLIVFLLAANNSAYLLRGYSMELFCTVYGLWIILNIQKKDCSNKRLLLYSLILSLLITARYATIMIVFGYSLYIVYLISRNNESLKNKIIRTCIYGIPLTITVSLIYLISMRIQNPNTVPIYYISYFKDDILGMFNIYHISLYLFVIIILFLKKKFNKDFINIFYPFCIVEFLFIGLSLVGLQPCNLIGDKNEPLLLLYLICGYSSMHKIVQKVNYGYISIILILSITIGFINHGSIRNTSKSLLYKTATNLKKININQYPKVYVSFWYSPTIRYLYEYDNFSIDLSAYKEKFLFAESYTHNEIREGDGYTNIILATERGNNTIKTLPPGSLIIKTYENSNGLHRVKSYHEFFVKE